MSVEIVTGFTQISDSNGAPVSGALVYVYDVGTTTLRSIYSDTGLATTAANPIVCDSAGRHDMRYTATGSYKIVVKTSAGVTLYTRDNIDGRVPVGSGALAIANGGTGATDAATALSNLGGVTQSELDAISTELATLSGQLASTEKTHIATGTTAQRPSSPVAGDIRHNTTVSFYEGYIAAWHKFVTTTASTYNSAAQPGKAATYQELTSGSGATYTTATGATWLRIRMIGGGGGGGAATTNAGSSGGTTTFNSISAAGGSGGADGATGLGGTGGTGGAGSATLRVNGSTGTNGEAATQSTGGTGGAGFMSSGAGKGAARAAGNAAGNNAGTNSGAGGGGATAGTAGAGGGGGGEYAEIIIEGPAATYTYTVGAGGAGGSAGGAAGGNGGSGRIVVEEFYQ